MPTSRIDGDEKFSGMAKQLKVWFGCGHAMRANVYGLRLMV
jgi:hypothetical protein